GIVSDGKDYSNVDFGENVGDDLDYFEKNQYYNTKGYMKDDGSFKVVVTPKKGESELEAITNGHYKIKKTDDFLYAQEGNNQQIIDELSKGAKIKSIIDPYNNYIVTVSREEGINILAVPKAKSWKENQSKDFHEAVGNIAKSNKKVAENWKNKKYLSAAGNGLISVLNVPNLIQTGAGSTTADLVYSFNPGEVQFGKKKDILERRGANKAKAKGTTDSLVSLVGSSFIPDKIGGGTITVPSTAQAVVATGEVAGTTAGVISLSFQGIKMGGFKAVLMVSGVGNGSNNSAKVRNDIDNYKGAEKQTTATKTKKDLAREQKANELIQNGKTKEAEKLKEMVWKTDSKKLDEELLKAGVVKPDYKCAAHHIVTDKMDDVVKILKDNDIDINSAANGVYLPTKGAKLSEVGKEAIHIGATSKEYRDKITERIIKVVEKANNNNLSKSATKDAILKEIDNIRNDLLTGKLKINNAKLKS
ncbi:AHH domain-containing protein, partial [Fusobacterium nucleatum]